MADAANGGTGGPAKGEAAATNRRPLKPQRVRKTPQPFCSAFIASSSSAFALCHAGRAAIFSM